MHFSANTQKEELVGLLHPVNLWKNGSEMHLWVPSCFYNYMDRDCLKPFTRTETNPYVFKNCSSRSHEKVLTHEPWFDNHVSLGLNVSNFDQDRNLRSGHVWLLWTPILSLIMLRTNVKKWRSTYCWKQLWWFRPHMDNGSSISNFHGHIAGISFQAFWDFFPLLHFSLSKYGGFFWFSNTINHLYMHLGVIRDN